MEIRISQDTGQIEIVDDGFVYDRFDTIELAIAGLVVARQGAVRETNKANQRVAQAKADFLEAKDWADNVGSTLRQLRRYEGAIIAKVLEEK